MYLVLCFTSGGGGGWIFFHTEKYLALPLKSTSAFKMSLNIFSCGECYLNAHKKGLSRSSACYWGCWPNATWMLARVGHRCLSWKPFPVFYHLHGKEIFPSFLSQPPWWRFVPLPCVLSLATSGVTCSFLPLLPFELLFVPPVSFDQTR